MKWGKLFAWMLLAASLTLALFPWKREKSARITAVYCLDSSASLSERERAQMRQAALTSISQARAAGVTIEIICFGSGAKRIEKLPEELTPQPASDLYLALQLALAIVEKHGQPGKILLFSDGSGVDCLPELANQCADRKVPVFIWTPPLRKDWKLISIEVPEQVGKGMKIPISLRYRSDFRGKMTLRLYAGKKLYLTKTIDAQKTEEGFAKFLGPPLPEGPAYIFAKATGDTREENNRAFAFTRVVPVSSVLLVSEEKNSPLKHALAAQKIPVELTSWKQLPPLANYRVIILHRPSKGRMKNSDWQDYLKQGGSILICGNELNIPWAPTLPLKKSRPRPEPVKTPDKPPLKKEKTKAEIEFRTAAIVFVIDCSTSMEGEKLRLAQESTFSAITRLWTRDLIGVIKFHNEASWVVPLGRGTNLEWIARRLKSIVPEGGTSILPALTMAYLALKPAHTHIKHVILLSDGQDENHVFVRKPLWKLVDEMQANGITITSIGIGGGYDEYLMPKLAEWSGGEFYFADEFHELPVAVLRDVDRVLGIRKLPPETQVPDLPKIDIPPKTPVAPPVESIKDRYLVKKRPGGLLSHFEKFPPLKDFSPSSLQKGAIAELTAGDFPLLAHWQWKKGRVMAWNSVLKEWSTWPEYARFWARVLRFLDARSSLSARFSLHCLKRETDKVYMLLKAYDLEDAAITIMSEYPFYRTGEREWQAVVPAPKAGIWRDIAVKVKCKDKVIAALSSAFALPFQSEFADLKIASKALEQMAQKTRGGYLKNVMFDQMTVEKTRGHSNTKNWETIFAWLAFFSCLAWLLTTEIQ